MPSKKDLEVAFDTANKSKSGTIDERELISLYKLVKKGDVKGLHQRRTVFTCCLRYCCCCCCCCCATSTKQRQEQQEWKLAQFAKGLVATDVLAPETLETLRKRFRAAVATDGVSGGSGRRRASGSGGAELGRKKFRAFLEETMAQLGEVGLPSERDLDAGFVIADADRNGAVSEEEFINLYRLIRKGEVNGLSGGSQREGFKHLLRFRREAIATYKVEHKAATVAAAAAKAEFSAATRAAEERQKEQRKAAEKRNKAAAEAAAAAASAAAAAADSSPRSPTSPRGHPTSPSPVERTAQVKSDPAPSTPVKPKKPDEEGAGGGGGGGEEEGIVYFFSGMMQRALDDASFSLARPDG